MPTRFNEIKDIPFLLEPGDLIVDEDGNRYLVRWAHAKRVSFSRGCGCCLDDAVDYHIYIDEPWHGPQPVIAQGGGTLLVMPVTEWWGDWPPKAGVFVVRDGRRVFPATKELDWHLEPDEMGF